MMYEVFLRRRAARQLDGVPFQDHRRILDRILALEEDARPAGCLKIAHDIYRIRVGPWRVVYMIHDTERWLDVGKIAGRREDTYRGVEDLFR